MHFFIINYLLGLDWSFFRLTFHEYRGPPKQLLFCFSCPNSHQ